MEIRDWNFVPAHFIPVFNAAHSVMWVEADAPDWEGGCVFDWFLSDPDRPLVLQYRSVVDWLRVFVETVRDGYYEPSGAGLLLLDSERQDELARERVQTYPPHDLYSDQVGFPLWRED